MRYVGLDVSAITKLHDVNGAVLDTMRSVRHSPLRHRIIALTEDKEMADKIADALNARAP
jgi:hypothetical protein